MTELPLLFVTVGSDHHPFDRLISWVDAWLGSGGERQARCVMQYGTAAAPHRATGQAFLPHGELQDLILACDVLVTQGGPMGIVETRRTGRLPIAVPRLHRLGEVVDDHQVAFCRLLSEEGELVLAETQDQLNIALDRAFADLPAMRIPVTSTEDAVRAAVERFGASVAELVQPSGSRARRA